MKQKITYEDLKQKIAALEIQQSHDFENLKKQYDLSQESFRAINIMKSTFNDVVFSTPSLKSNIVNGALALTTNYLSKNSLLGNSSNTFMRTIGRGLQLLLKNLKQ